MNSYTKITLILLLCSLTAHIQTAEKPTVEELCSELRNTKMELLNTRMKLCSELRNGIALYEELYNKKMELYHTEKASFGLCASLVVSTAMSYIDSREYWLLRNKSPKLSAFTSKANKANLLLGLFGITSGIFSYYHWNKQIHYRQLQEEKSKK